MFFKDYYNSIADILEAKFHGCQYDEMNPADKGELSELFVQEFLDSSLGDSFKIYRGGKIIDSEANKSNQLDILLCGKRSIKIFGDKGIYPTETVYGVISVTATLTKSKLLDCCNEFISIPRQNFKFSGEGYIDEQYIKDTTKTWQNIMPYKCVFAFKGLIREEWINDIIEVAKNSHNPYNAMPDLVVVNKVGVIEKSPLLDENKEAVFDSNGHLIPQFNFVPYSEYKNPGHAFSSMLYHLNNMNWEEIILKPALEPYFNKDL